MKKYWDETTNAALKEYQGSDIARRNVIFETTLLPAISKLVECVMAKSSISSLVDKDMLAKDCLQHVVSYLDRIDCEKNAFAYAQLTVKHYIFQHCKKTHKQATELISINLEDKNDEDCLDLLEGQIEKSWDNNPIVDENAEELLEKTLDYWTLDKLKKTLGTVPMSVHRRNHALNSIKYSLYKLGSPHIKFEQLNGNFKKQKNFNLGTASGYLNFLSKESQRVLLK